MKTAVTEKPFNKFLVNLFVILGPLGNLLTPHLISHAFRSYYLILLTFPFFYRAICQWQAKIVVFFTPFFLYAFISTLLVDHPEFKKEEVLFRFFLLLTQFLFVLGASSHFFSFKEVRALIMNYTKAVFLSVIIGYLLYLALNLEWLSLKIFERFSVLTQTGYGLVRFSPGSYPNEYGITASFTLAILTLIFQENGSLSRKNPLKKNFLGRLTFHISYFLTLGALLLTTTRAAYLAYLWSLLYLLWKKKKSAMILIHSSLAILSIVVIFNFFSIDILGVINSGFKFSALETDSLGERLSLWKIASTEFTEKLWLGSGFSYYSNLHNLYLQLLFEMGIFGFFTLIAALFFTLVERRFWHFKSKVSSNEEFVKKVISIGLIHVLWFGISNHNLNHHLTWFIILLSLSCRSLYRSELKN